MKVRHLAWYGCSLNQGAGDPFAVHAAFVVLVCEWSQPVMPLDIVSNGRLGRLMNV